MMQCNVEQTVINLGGFSQTAGASLDLLRAVEMTVDALRKEQTLLSAFIKTGRNLQECVQNLLHSEVIDHDDSTAQLLEQVEKKAQDVYDLYTRKMQSAIDDKKLNGDHKEDVVSEYKQTLELLAEFHNLLSELRWAIMEHDADVAEEAGTYSNIEDLSAHLKRLRG